MKVKFSFPSSDIVFKGQKQKKYNELFLNTLRTLDRKKPDLVAPNFHGTFRYHSGLRESKTLEGFAFLSWYLDDHWRVMIQLWLSNRIEKLADKDLQVSLRLILSNRTIAHFYLEDKYGIRTIRGNLLPRWIEALSSIECVFQKPGRVKKTQRKRGYADHGSLRPAHRWMERFDASLTELQNEIEEERQSLKDTADIIEGWLS